MVCDLKYSDDTKDANEYFKSHTIEDFRGQIGKAKPYYTYKYQGIGDIIDSILSKPEPHISLDSLPYIKLKEDSLVVISGDSGEGKTSYVLNIANELVGKDIPTLVLPFERGIKTVGQRYLQVRYNKEEEDLEVMDQSDWAKIRDDAVNLPIYFSMPAEKELEGTIARAKRLFNTKVIIIDHLDYFVHGQDRIARQADMMNKLKTIAQENEVCILVVHHISKPENRKRSRPTKEDLKGSSDIYQIPESVVLLYRKDKQDKNIEIIVDKNKGEEGIATYEVNMRTGKFSFVQELKDSELAKMQQEVDEVWDNM